MGLDMYLYKKTYVWQPSPYGDQDTQPNKNFRVEGLEFQAGQPIPVDSTKVKYIVEQSGYWRKANAIHKWFVDNVQKGVDDCGEYYVGREEMQKLLDTINLVLFSTDLVEGEITNGYQITKEGRIPIKEQGKRVKNPAVAQELLPATDGFFFGSTDYDQYYWQDLEDTKKILEAAIADEHGDFYYSSSW